jgi:hypothetical protein
LKAKVPELPAGSIVEARLADRSKLRGRLGDQMEALRYEETRRSRPDYTQNVAKGLLAMRQPDLPILRLLLAPPH